MSTQTGTATSYLDLLNQLRAFLTGVGSAGAPSFAGTGTGTMSGVTCYPGTKTETITVKCTSAATPGAEVWSVTGSVSGALANATTGVAYTSAEIGFTINAGATNFAVNDQFTIATTQGAMSAAGSAWTELAKNSTPYSGQPGANDTVDFETYLKAPGLSGTEAIYLNIRAFHYTSGDYYNFELRGAQGYNASNAFTAQPGISPAAYVYLWNQSTPYWFIANGQRVIVVAKVSTVYEMFYMGKFLPYGTPGQYPYPVAIGGCGYSSSDLRFSDTSYSHLAFFDPNGLLVCDSANAWQLFQNFNTGGSMAQSPYNNVWPYCYCSSDRPNWMSANLDGTYSVFPVRLEQTSPAPSVLGELDGVGFVTGNSNSSESTVNDGTNNWMVVQNVFRTAADNYCAVKMA